MLDGCRADNRKLMLTMPELYAEHLIPPKRLAEMREQANQEIIRRLASGARIPDDLPQEWRDKLPTVPEGYIPPEKSSYELESLQAAAAAEAARANSEIETLRSQISTEAPAPSTPSDPNSEISNLKSEISDLKSQISDEAPQQPPSPPH